MDNMHGARCTVNRRIVIAVALKRIKQESGISNPWGPDPVTIGAITFLDAVWFRSTYNTTVIAPSSINNVVLIEGPHVHVATPFLVGSVTTRSLQL
jgi:hypothetical protein